jgi:hypothetical protein
MGFSRNVRGGLLAAVAMGAMTLPGLAMAQERAVQDYNIEGQGLAEALRVISRQSGREITFPADAVAGKRAPSLHGHFTPEQAVRALLDGTNLVAEFRKDGILIRGRSEAPGEIGERPASDSEIVVTGSHIRGAIATSPVLISTRAKIEAAGQTDLGSFARSLPRISRADRIRPSLAAETRVPPIKTHRRVRP